MPPLVIVRDNPVSGAIPLASDIGVAELVVNTADGYLYTKNTAGALIRLNGSSAGIGFPYYGDAYISGSLTVSGTVSAVAFNSISDIQHKEAITPIDDALTIIDHLQGVRFIWKASQEPSVGLIAQEVEAVLPELVTTLDTGKVLNYNGLIGVLVQAVKDLTKRVEELEHDKLQG
jgi:hypothetical protein